MIKSHVLCQLSYGPIEAANLTIFRKMQGLFYDLKELDDCQLCPRRCGVNRNAGKLGYCGSDAAYNIASICIHKGEEPAISGSKGICNVFFSRCNLQCIYCQNYQISRRREKVESRCMTLDEVTGSICKILDQGIEAVGFVTPTHHSPHVKAIIQELHYYDYHPVTIYNTNGFDSTEVLRQFEGLIDVYLPDFKYFDRQLAARYSDAADYPEIIKKNLLEMYRQKGSTVVFNDDGMAVTGLIIRHLVLPGHVEDSIRILNWIASELSTSVHISLMSQYYPTVCVANHPELGRKLTRGEYEKVMVAMENFGFARGWIQHTESAESYLPDFKSDQPFERSGNY
jgi:putative pyruvate formate lyase activating enzyme